MVRVLAGWHGQLEGVEADVVKGLVINAVGLISILYQLMDKGGGIVGLTQCRTLGEGATLKVFMMQSGYSLWILLVRKVPIPEPVPQPSEWVSWSPTGSHSSLLPSTPHTELSQPTRPLLYRDPWPSRLLQADQKQRCVL